MNERQSKLLAAIIDQFIHSASPVGSKKLLEAGHFHCSSATLRNEMSFLEDQGFLEQPHVSAGRIPTAKGYRCYVASHLQPSRSEQLVRDRFDVLRRQYFQRKDQERVYEAVALLSHMIPDVAFATVPHKERVYFMGLSNVLKQPEFLTNPQMASGVVEILESNMDDVLGNIAVDDLVRYYIGEENILPQFQSCSLVITRYAMGETSGVIGILGPMRMDYSYNTVSLDLVADLLRRQ